MSASLPPLLFAVLQRLSDGRFHSGEALARDFGVSRATIFNLVRSAETLGLVVHSVRGRGYRLASPYAWLDEAELAAAMPPHSFDVVSLAQSESTNSLLMRQALDGAPHRSVRVTQYQQGGRGRRGRAWAAAPGGGLMFSVLWRFEHGIDRLSGLSLVAGLALVRALATFAPMPLKLKWPNDVLAGYRKLAGILVEVQGEVSGPSFAVIGMGINQHLPLALREDIDQAVVDLAELGVAASRARLLAAILAELDVQMQRFESSGLDDLLSEWPRWHAHEGRDVVLRLPDDSRCSGQAEGLDAAGNLILRLADGSRRHFGSGEVSLRTRA